MANHPEVIRELSGQWVVLEPAGVIVHGSDPVELVKQAREKAIEVPYLVLIGGRNERTVSMGL